MPPHTRATDPADDSSDSRVAGRRAGPLRRTRPRVDLTSDSAAARIQRMLVLADRFRALAVLKSDPVRLVDLLRNIVSLARETFGTDFSRDRVAGAVIRMDPDQLRCVRDLERLLQGLAYGSPDAWRGLGHAMDALLIQCFLFDASAGESAEPIDP